MCLFIYLFVWLCICVTPPDQTKNVQTWNLALILLLTLSKNGSFVFSKKSPWWPLASKNCHVMWIFSISLPLPCFCIYSFQINNLSLYIFFYFLRLFLCYQDFDEVNFSAWGRLLVLCVGLPDQDINFIKLNI